MECKCEQQIFQTKYEGAFILEYGMLTQACRYSEEPKLSDDEGILQINDKVISQGNKAQ